jgi:hypothetical protein
MVAVLTLQTGDLTFEFAMNEDGAKAMARNLQQFLDMVQSRGAPTSLTTPAKIAEALPQSRAK